MDLLKNHPLGALRDYNRRKKEELQFQRNLGNFAIFIILGWIIVTSIGLYLSLSKKEIITPLGQAGDFSALFNTLLNGLTLFYLIASIRMQSQDLQLTKEEMKLQTDAHEKSQKALEEQNLISKEQKNYDDLRNHIEGLQFLLKTPWNGDKSVDYRHQLYWNFRYLIDGTHQSDHPIFKEENFTNSLRIIHFKLTSIVLLLKSKTLKKEDKCVLLLEITIVLHEFFHVQRETNLREWEKRDLPGITEKTLWSFMQHLEYLSKEYEKTMKENKTW